MILQKRASLNQYIFGLSPVLDSVFTSFLPSTGTKYVFIVRARPGMPAMSTAPPALIHPSTHYSAGRSTHDCFKSPTSQHNKKGLKYPVAPGPGPPADQPQSV